MSTAKSDPGDRAYVAFTRKLLDDMAAGSRRSAGHYAAMFPECAERIREDLPERSGDGTRVEFHDGDEGTEAEPGKLPEKIGKYEITGDLATGGMGRLFLARNPDIDKRVVIKTTKAGLVASDTRAIDRLRREAVILGRLEHDRICPVTDVIVEGERVFVVMPFIEGETLEKRLNDASERMRTGAHPSLAWSAIGAASSAASGGGGEPSSAASGGTKGSQAAVKTARDARVGLRAVLALMEEVARAIHAAHLQKIVHRDLKPGNIMVRPDGHPVVLDFGLAVDLSAEHARRLTSYGDVIGTPAYMAPEQIRSESDAIGPRSDVYALGVILYELLTFRRAFTGSDLHALYNRILAGRIDPPRSVNPTIPRDLEAVCQRAMEVDPRRRYATALELAEDLRRVRTLEATLARPISGVERAVRALRRHPRAIAGIVSGAVVLAGALILLNAHKNDEMERMARASGAYVRVQDAHRGGKPPADADEEILHEVVPDAKTYDLLVAHPKSPTAFEEFLGLLRTQFRAGSIDTPGARLIAPRCGIIETRPVFRFEIAAGIDASRVGISLARRKDHQAIPVTITRREGRVVEASLAEGQSLDAGKGYDWAVQLPPGPGDTTIAPATASFWVVEAAKRSAALATVRPRAASWLGGLERAATLLVLGLAQEALDTLDALPTGLPPEAAEQALLFRAKALDALGDAAGLSATKALYLAGAAPESRR